MTANEGVDPVRAVEAGACGVWWASPDDVRDWHWDLLAPPERARYERLRRPEDRARSVVGAALLRLVAGTALGAPPADVTVDRTCAQCGEQHGKPALDPSTGLHASVSHSGERVAVALCGAAPLGVDVETLDRKGSLDVHRMVLADEERAEWLAVPEAERRRTLYGYWTRKEAVLKATGEGLNAALTGVRVSAPDAPPRVVSCTHRPTLATETFLADLSPGAGYVGCVAVLDAGAREVVETDAGALLTEPR